MRVFISYSTPDLGIVHRLANQIKPLSEVFYWAESKLPGQEAWRSIFGWIDQADLVIVLITGNTVSRAFAVGQEVGRAVTQGRTIVPIVSSDVPSSELGCLGSITYQPINLADPQPAIEQVSRVVHAYKLDRQEKQKQWLILLSLIGAIALLSRE